MSLKGLSFQSPVSAFRRGCPARARALMECGGEGTSLTRSYTYRKQRRNDEIRCVPQIVDIGGQLFAVKHASQSTMMPEGYP